MHQGGVGAHDAVDFACEIRAAAQPLVHHVERAVVAFANGLQQEAHHGVHGRGARQLVGTSRGFPTVLGAVDDRSQLPAVGMVDPRRAHNQVLRVQLAYELLAGKLRLAVECVGLGAIELVAGTVLVPGEHVIAGYLHQQRVDGLGGNGQIARPQSIRLHGGQPVFCRHVVAADARAVHHDGRAVAADEFRDLVKVRHVHFMAGCIYRIAGIGEAPR